MQVLFSVNVTSQSSFNWSQWIWSPKRNSSKIIKYIYLLLYIYLWLLIYIKTILSFFHY